MCICQSEHNSHATTGLEGHLNVRMLSIPNQCRNDICLAGTLPVVLLSRRHFHNSLTSHLYLHYPA